MSHNFRILFYYFRVLLYYFGILRQYGFMLFFSGFKKNIKFIYNFWPFRIILYIFIQHITIAGKNPIYICVWYLGSYFN